MRFCNLLPPEPLHFEWGKLIRQIAIRQAEPGTLVTFRAETMHEVTPVTHGVRFTIATWFR